jgi:phosphoglucosamine mutase
MKYYNKPLVELSHEIPLVPQSLINVKVKEKKDFETLSKLQVAIKEVESDLKNAGRILLRYSGTENLARVMVEGEDANLVLKSSQKIANILKQEIGA